MKLTAAEYLADYLADTRSPPGEVVNQAKIHVADTIACIYAGTGSDAVKLLADANKWRGCTDDIPVPGWGYVKTVDGAAQLLGTAAHAHDFDDKSYLMPGHPSAPIVAALMATTFDLSKHYTHARSGLDFIQAYIKGIEVAGKLGEQIAEDHTDQGWHNISTVALVAAAAACAALRGLDADLCARTVAIACSHAGGILNNSGSMVKPLHSGNAARAGYLAAALGEKGFTAGSGIFDGNYGFVHAFTGGRRSSIDLPPVDTREPNLPPLTGEHFELIYPGIEVKRYPCCHVAHPCIDAMKEMRGREEFRISDVRKVICFVPTLKRMSYLQCPDPKTPTEARFSMNFAVATAMLYGNVTLDHFNDAQLASTDFRGSMALVEMRLQHDEAVDVEVIFQDGTRWSAQRVYEPASWDDVASKMRTCMKHASQPSDPTPILAALKGLDEVDDVSGIF